MSSIEIAMRKNCGGAKTKNKNNVIKNRKICANCIFLFGIALRNNNNKEKKERTICKKSISRKMLSVSRIRGSHNPY